MTLVLGLPLPRPLAFFRGCQIYPEPTTAFSTPITTNGTGRWSMTKVAVPNQASVKGLRLVSQAAVASGPTMPFGSDSRETPVPSAAGQG